MKVYLDNNATTAMRKEVREVLVSKLLDGNASSMYSSGRISEEHVENARENVRNLMGAASAEVLFTSGATEANNTVLQIARKIIEKNKKGRILTTKIEHPSIIEVLKGYSAENISVTFCGVDKKGCLDLKEYENELKKGDVILASVMTANNETGAVQPVKEACALAHKYKSLFHTDATQAMGKLDFQFDAMDIDYASISAHKFYGPKGIGALVYKKIVPFYPFMIGGHQENGRRAGTYNSNAIYAMGIAAKLAKEEQQDEAKKLKKLKDSLKKGLSEKIENIRFNSDDKSSLPGTLNISFRDVEGESILLMLDFEGIEVSTGSACATGSLEPSYVLLAGGIPVEDAHSSIRFSFGRYNTQKDVDYVLEKLPEIIEKLRKISTRGKK